MARSARYLGLFAWFGGTLMGLTGVERGAQALPPMERRRFADDAWRRASPVVAAGMVAHVLGSAALGWAGRHRAWTQRGMPTAMVLDTLATTVGIAAWVAAERLRNRTPADPAAAAADHDGERRARVIALLGAGGSVLAQGYLAEQQQVLPGTPMGRGALHPVARAVGDLGLAGWFGGTLMGLVALNRAVEGLASPRQRLQVSDAAWQRWAPFGATGVVLHLLGSAVIARGNTLRLTAQRPMARDTALQGALSVLAAAATAAAGLPRTQRRRLRMLQWSAPALLAAVVVVNARMSEQQRPMATAAGVLAALRR